MFVLKVGEQAGHDEEVKKEPHCDHEQGRLDEEPPEALPVRVEQGQSIGLDERPENASERGRRPEGGHDPHARGGSL
jgi:hypothetical protein